MTETPNEDLVLAHVEDSLTDNDAELLARLQFEAIKDLDAALSEEVDGSKLDSSEEFTPEFTGLGLMSVPAVAGVDMKALRKRVIDRAVSQVGTKERPAYSNHIWAWDDCKPAWQGQPWCAAAVTSWWGRAGVDLRKFMSNPYYCPFLEKKAKDVGAWRSRNSGYTPKLGDPILFGRGLATHVGISYPGPGNWSGYRTIEGNTSASNAGSQTNGDGCYIRYRSGSFIRGWIDMDVFVAAMVKSGALKPTGGKVEKPKLVTAQSKPAARKPIPISFRVYNKPGASGNRRLIQMQLKGQGFYKGVPNGIDDKAHREAVKAYQLAIGDEDSADGVLGPKQFALIAKWRDMYYAVA